jgi:RHS repeat-associated protein
MSITNQIGSVILVAKADGSIKQRLTYDPFGLINIAEDYSADETSRMLWSGYASMQGFTGHEHMYELELIHMKGRVYDPTVGRFLQADVVVQSPNLTLSYNRYAYVWNNPLAMTDPSGYEGETAEENKDSGDGEVEEDPNGENDKRHFGEENEDLGRDLEALHHETKGGLSKEEQWNPYSVDLSRASDGVLYSNTVPGSEKSIENNEAKQCVSSCIENRYGSVYEVAESLNPLSAASLLTSEAAELLSGRIETTGIRNTYGNSKDWKVGTRQLKTAAQFNNFNASMAVVGSGAAGFMVGAQMYCSFECR